MSIQSEITRIETAKSDIASAIGAKGVTVPTGTKLDGMASLIEDIEAAANPVLQTKTVTPTTAVQNVTPDSGYDGLSKVMVNAIPSQYIVPSGTKSITANGTHDVKKYASANVNVQSAPVLLWTNASPASHFAAQTVTLASGYSGFIVEIRRDTTYDLRAYAYFPINSSYGAITYYSGSQLFIRGVDKTTSNRIVFSVCWLNAITQNNLAIPTRIWGVKWTL